MGFISVCSRLARPQVAFRGRDRHEPSADGLGKSTCAPISCEGGESLVRAQVAAYGFCSGIRHGLAGLKQLLIGGSVEPVEALKVKE